MASQTGLFLQLLVWKSPVGYKNWNQRRYLATFRDANWLHFLEVRPHQINGQIMSQVLFLALVFLEHHPKGVTSYFPTLRDTPYVRSTEMGPCPAFKAPLVDSYPEPPALQLDGRNPYGTTWKPWAASTCWKNYRRVIRSQGFFRRDMDFATIHKGVLFSSSESVDGQYPFCASRDG